MEFQDIPRIFIFCTKNNTMAVLLKTASVRVSSIQIIQVRVQNKGKSVWKSRYNGDVSITDPSKPSRVDMRRGKRKIIGMDGVANEQDFDKYGNPKIEHDDDDEVAAYTTRRSSYSPNARRRSSKY